MIVLLFLMLVLNPLPLHSTLEKNQIEYSKKQLGTIQTKLKDLKNKIYKKKRKQKKTRQSLGKVKRSLYIKERELKKTTRSVNVLEKRIKSTAKQLITINANYHNTQELVQDRLAYLYKYENDNMYSIILGSRSLSHTLVDKYAFEKFLEDDFNLLTQLQKQHKTLLDTKDQLYKDKKHKQQLLSKIKHLKKSLSQKNIELNQSLKKLSYDIAKFEKQQSELEKDSNEISDLILKQTKNLLDLAFSGNLFKPAKGWISSRFGYRNHPIFKRRILHSGIDIAAPIGREIRSASKGFVIFAGWKKGYGYTTIIDHGTRKNKKISTVYAHQSRIVVKANQYVEKGKLIGYVGNTGYSTGPHLHFEVRENGKPINPTRYLKL